MIHTLAGWVALLAVAAGVAGIVWLWLRQRRIGAEARDTRVAAQGLLIARDGF